ncbi:MAG: ABC transporter permease [Candidatus Howiella sp.]
MRYKTGFFGKIYLWLVLLLLYLPIVTVVVYSFNDSKSSAEWVGFTLDWYRRLFTSGKYEAGLQNSLLVAVCSVIGAGVIGTSAAVGAASRSFRTRGAFESLSILPIMIPEIIMGMSLLSVFTMAGIPLGLGAIILAHITFCIPYIYLVVRSRLSGMDKSVVEAARDLGASRTRAFLTVTVPLLAPAIGGGCLLAFAMSFDDVVISFFLMSPGADMLPVQIYSALKLGLTPEINALFTMMLSIVILAIAVWMLFSKLLPGRTKKSIEIKKTP